MGSRGRPGGAVRTASAGSSTRSTREGAGRLGCCSPPKIEYPFSEEIAFRVARTGSCLRLREEAGEDGSVLACLPDGERLLLAEHAEPDYWPPHPSIVLTGTPQWVYVRTEDGAEGWVSHDYLAHD